MHEVPIRTSQHSQLINIDAQVQALIDDSGVRDGVCTLFVPHTTAGITINENADPDVVRDLLLILDRVVPWKGNYAHAEGNSAAHAKAAMMGFSQQVLIRDGRLQFGTWQSIYFCEFDGPRSRKLWVHIAPDR